MFLTYFSVTKNIWLEKCAIYCFFFVVMDKHTVGILIFKVLILVIQFTTNKMINSFKQVKKSAINSFLG